MFRPLLSLLPLLGLCLPALAGMPAGLQLGDTEKDVLKKAYASSDFTQLSERAKRKLEGNYSLNTQVGGQQWLAHFIFDRRSKMLTQLIFVGDKAMQPNQYNKALKPFYVFTTGHLRQHFKLQEALNQPEFGHAGSLKTEEIFPLHAFPGEGIMLTTGLWKAKDGGIHLCFMVQPASNSALGQTFASNTTGKASDWANVPDFASTEEGKAFMEATGLTAVAPPVEEVPEEEPEEEPKLVEEEPEEPAEPAMAMAPESLPQVEQDMLNAIILFHHHKTEEGLAKLVAAAQAGNSRALYELGCGYASGKHGLSPSRENAENAFRKAAAGGFALALVRYGAEFPVALAELGLSAEDGRKMVQAAEAADASSPSARFNRAIMLRYGYGLRKDAEQALNIMQQLAEEGDPVAEVMAAGWEP